MGLEFFDWAAAAAAEVWGLGRRFQCEIFIALNEYLSRCNASLSIALSL